MKKRNFKSKTDCFTISFRNHIHDDSYNMSHIDELFILENDVKWRNGNI